jgi:ribosome-associated protein
MVTLLDLVQTCLADLKAQDIVVLPVAKLSALTDYMVLATATSSMHLQAVAEYVLRQAKTARYPALGVDGLGVRQADWVLLDLNTVMVHIMLAEARQLYQLEKLWGTPPSADLTS